MKNLTYSKHPDARQDVANLSTHHVVMPWGVFETVVIPLQGLTN